MAVVMNAWLIRYIIDWGTAGNLKKPDNQHRNEVCKV